MSDIVLPPGVTVGEEIPTVGPVGPGHVVVDNRTELPDEMVEQGVRDFFVENASMAWGHQGTFQTYTSESGSMLARSKFYMPTTVFAEICLARDIADRDDDIRAAMGAIIAIAYSGGMQNFHEDDRTRLLFNEVAANANLDHQLKEMLREYLIAAQCTTVSLFTRTRLSFRPTRTADEITERVAAPLLGILHAENIRVVDSDLFGQGTLAYLPDNPKLRTWLEAYFDPQVSPGRKNQLALEDPVSAALFTERYKLDEYQSYTSTGMWVYGLNPRMAQRFTMPKGAHKYPRPLLTADFALIEAKRLLNIMDYALLQGGANFIVVAKKGSDQHRASQPELEALGQTVARASRSGVIVGDHRLSFEIITPKLDELLNSQKRSLIARKLVNVLLRTPEPGPDARAEGVKAATEIMSRVVTQDRLDVKRHVERTIYAETAKRNTRVMKGAAKIWHPAIILQGTQFFTDYVLKLRDRGDIPRKWAAEAAGFDWDAGVEQRKSEKADDKIMVPAAVPFSPGGGGAPTDNFNGRPPGSGPNNGAPGAQPGPGQDPFAPKRTTRGPGEPVKAWWDEDAEDVVRVGETTYRLLEQYPDREEGRLTQAERKALETGEPEGSFIAIALNEGYEVSSTRMLRLAPGLGVLIGYRAEDDAIVAKALTFRTPEFDEIAAEELALRLGWGRPQLEEPADD